MPNFPFLHLPLELRDQIYSHYFRPADHLVPGGNDCECEEGARGGGRYKWDFALFRVNKQIKTEAEDVWRRDNVFVRIETPWPQAEHHISHEGLVPLVSSSPAAQTFKHASMTLSISAPLHDFMPQHTIIVLLSDLHLFCQVWFYSALNYRTLNEHLKVEFTLHDAYYPADPKPIPIQLQRKLLLPFTCVKGLYEVEVSNFDEELERELRVGMAVPYDSVAHCLEAGQALVDEGDKALSQDKLQEALDLYIKAQHAIHILVQGRTRRVMADSYFHEDITTGRFKGQTGTTIRIIMRINLVSRVVVAYLKLGEWNEAAFWGLRSINLLRQGMGTEFESFLMDLVAVADIGVLYLRTGIAIHKLEQRKDPELNVWREEDHQDSDMVDSEILFRASGRYLEGKDRGMIRKELDEYGVKVDERWFRPESTMSDVDSMAPMDQSGADTDAVEYGGLDLDEGEGYVMF